MASDNCQTYADKKYCTIDGDIGSEWTLEHGTDETFEDYAVNGEDATTCPQCGCQGNTIIESEMSDYGLYLPSSF